MALLKELLGHPIELYNLLKFMLSGSAVPKLDQDSLSEGLRVCYKYLVETSRSFAVIIQAVDDKPLRSVSPDTGPAQELLWIQGDPFGRMDIYPGYASRHVVCIFYLVLRALDTVEDDVTISLERKVPLLQNFHSYLYQPDWKFMDSNEKDKQVLEDFPTISGEFRKLEKVYQDVIADTCQKMGHGMAEFLGKKIDSVKDWDRYCHYVAGLVGIGLARIVSVSGLEDPKVCQQTELANSVGLFLQKTNIIRDYLEDHLEGREFWPKEVWSKYAEKLSDLAKPENIDKAVQCMNELITNALHHVPDVLTTFPQVRNQPVLTAYALPHVMAIATLAACYNNQQVFRGVVKIRKGEAVTLMMKATNLEAIKAIMYHYVEEIYQKIPSTDPSASKTKQIVSSIRPMCKPSSGFVSRTKYLPIYVSCVMLLLAFWWQYLSAI